MLWGVGWHREGIWYINCLLKCNHDGERKEQARGCCQNCGETYFESSNYNVSQQHLILSFYQSRRYCQIRTLISSLGHAASTTATLNFSAIVPLLFCASAVALFTSTICCRRGAYRTLCRSSSSLVLLALHCQHSRGMMHPPPHLHRLRMLPRQRNGSRHWT